MCFRLSAAARLLAAVAALLLADAAAALSLATNPIPLVGTGPYGTIVMSVELVATVTGTPVGGVVTIGTVAAGDTTLVFRGSIDATSDPIAVFGVAADDDGLDPLDSVAFSGAGIIAGAGADVLLTTFQPAEESVAVSTPTPLLSSFAPGTVTDLFFLSYATPPAPGQFIVVGATTDINDLPLPLRNTSVVLPEPGAGALLGPALAVLGARAARRGAGRPARVRAA